MKSYKLNKYLELLAKAKKNKAYREQSSLSKAAKARRQRKQLKVHQRRNGTDKQR